MFNAKEMEFIIQNADADCTRLLLSGGKNPEIRVRECVEAILARRKLKEKVPEWFANPAIEYPLQLSVEQCSSQSAALYKRSIVKSLFPTGESFSTADITGGMGIDSYFIAGASGYRHLYMERNAELCRAAKENFSLLGADGIEILNADCREALQELERFNPSLIYADPARRASGSGGKLILIKDYEPDITALKGELLRISPYLLIKVSPMADIKLNLRLLPETLKVYVVAVENECKELLFLLGRERLPQGDDCRISAVNIKGKGGGISEFQFTLSEEDREECVFAESALPYLFEPGKAILKAGAFKSIAKRLGVAKLAPSTHLYFASDKSVASDKRVAQYGKLFRILSIREFGKEELKGLRKEYPKANIIARNFPMSTEEVRKRAKIEDGGEIYLFFTTLTDNRKRIIACVESRAESPEHSC